MPVDSETQTDPHDDAPVTASKQTYPDRTLVAETVTINRLAGELYAFWRDFTNLVAVMDNVKSIEAIDDTRSHWIVKAPAGREVSWDSVVTKEVAGEEITWQSAPGADVANSGRIEFIDAGDRGTVVRAVISYEAPGGTMGQFVAKLFQREPRIQARRDLRRFKQLMETGEIATAAWTARQRKDEQA